MNNTKPFEYGSESQEDFRRGRNYVEDGDQEEERDQDLQEDVTIPENVKNFLTFFHNSFHRKSYDVYKIYEFTFDKLTEKFYKKQPWPSPNVVKSLLNDNSVFLMCYKELYYRHIYSKLSVSLRHRVESWVNYCELFNHFLGSSSIDLNLPLQWLWDMIDEFIYQFQSYCQYRVKLLKSKHKNKQDIEYIKENPQIWDVTTVLQYLHSFQAKSKIVEVLEAEKEVGHPLCEDDEELLERFGVEVMIYYLGYFSTIGLVRVNCLLSDYYLALKLISPIELTREKTGVSSKVLGCHVTLFYYVGFAYLMLRRYSDAIKTFSTIISHTQRSHNQNRQHEQLGKRTEQIYNLLAIAVSLSPTRIDEFVHTNLREKCGEKMQRMQRGELQVFEEMFSFSCPKFISPSPPDFDDDLSQTPQTSHQIQLKLFMQEVNQQVLIPTIRSYLRLYTSIPLSKLQYFLESLEEKPKEDKEKDKEKEEEKVIKYLLCFKHKMKAQQWSGSGGPLNSKWSVQSDLDFHIDKDMIHVADTKMSRKYGEYFIRQINKLEEVISSVKMLDN